ncbi:hypothetical protein BDV38DRAFT_279886 [Aspergillus pseudotamarii]|uniref:Uncharacterized protein n=1 Tax=Aspergillus pseudotamarii TaxID=132259 RepID=A0A5N6T3Y2_ASPPS|nr:uncharacterized protein BDV38DRAFT_279886 [Aspergillus pseudotamarii]KAE8140911.1 hypothetical protein BDV38DRAFT_279886 [Aspergillus pseudotamarii]
MSRVQRSKVTRDKDSFKGSFSIPESTEDWVRVAKSSSLLKKTLNDLSKLGSGSRVKKKQHILFKAIWDRPVKNDKLEYKAERYNLSGVWQNAKHLVASSRELQRYLALVDKPQNFALLTEIDCAWPGSWAPVLKWQNRVLEFCKRKPALETPSTGTRSHNRKRKHGIAPQVEQVLEDDKPPSDESITNTALVLFLDAVLSLVPSAGCEFTMFRVAFESNFRQAGFKALTDGALWITGDEEDVRAILEVKKGHRYDNYDRIRMQETAELVGWLKKPYQPWNELFNGHKILISEDGNEVWITFAKPSSTYSQYLSTDTPAEDAFLHMVTYGPYRLGHKEDMENLCIVIAAIVLRVAYSLRPQ